MELTVLFNSVVFPLLFFSFFNMKELGQYFPELPNLFYMMRKENHSYYEHCLGENNIIYGNFSHVTF